MDATCSVVGMPTLAETVKKARERKGLSQSQLARKVGVTPQAIQQLEAGDTKQPRYLIELGEALETPLSNLRPAKLRSEAGPPSLSEVQPPAELMGRRDLPVYTSAEAGPEGVVITYEPIEWVERPSILAGVEGAFAMYVVNDSMEPRYRQGDLLLIHPNKPVRRGDDVLCVLKDAGDEHKAYIKELVQMSPTKVVLKQHNPKKTLTLTRSDIAGLHKVLGAYWGN